ncbi:TetR/AcrR family transcriptional regulator [Candidatus Dependentiae bacterium]|nr:TetR/AcrR family transcriptional regulator [Candidatus Dependentiae bacterium]
MKIKKAENIEAEKNKIIEAGFRCFIKKGYARTSVNDIVKEYGKSKGNLYYYFTNKEDIFIEMIKKWTDETFEMATRLRESYNSAEDFLNDFIDGSFKFFDENKDFFRVKMEFCSISCHNEKLRILYNEAQNRWISLFMPFKKEFKSPKHFNIFLTSFFCVLDGMILRYILWKKFLTYEFKKEIKKDILLILKEKLK